MITSVVEELIASAQTSCDLITTVVLLTLLISCCLCRTPQFIAMTELLCCGVSFAADVLSRERALVLVQTIRRNLLCYWNDVINRSKSDKLWCNVGR